MNQRSKSSIASGTNLDVIQKFNMQLFSLDIAWFYHKGRKGAMSRL